MTEETLARYILGVSFGRSCLANALRKFAYICRVCGFRRSQPFNCLSTRKMEELRIAEDTDIMMLVAKDATQYVPFWQYMDIYSRQGYSYQYHLLTSLPAYVRFAVHCP